MKGKENKRVKGDELARRRACEQENEENEIERATRWEEETRGGEVKCEMCAGWKEGRKERRNKRPKERWMDGWKEGRKDQE
jgi:hypothetical protein